MMNDRRPGLDEVELRNTMRYNGRIVKDGGHRMTIMLIPLTQGKVAIIDDIDADRVLQHTWRVRKARNTSYAVADMQIDGKWRTVMMHRFITNAPAGYDVDHRDDNGLNNCRENLLVCSHQENLARQRTHSDNRSGYRGVNKQTISSSWVARICHRGQTFHLGSHPTPEAAARAYDAKARELYGPNARVNFPDQTKL